VYVSTSQVEVLARIDGKIELVEGTCVAKSA
jgi:hypothetical protein